MVSLGSLVKKSLGMRGSTRRREKFVFGQVTSMKDNANECVVLWKSRHPQHPHRGPGEPKRIRMTVEKVSDLVAQPLTLR